MDLDCEYQTVTWLNCNAVAGKKTVKRLKCSACNKAEADAISASDGLSVPTQFAWATPKTILSQISTRMQWCHWRKSKEELLAWGTLHTPLLHRHCITVLHRHCITVLHRHCITVLLYLVRFLASTAMTILLNYSWKCKANQNWICSDIYALA